MELTLSELGGTNLLLERVAGAIDIDVNLLLLEGQSNLLGVIKEAHANGDDHNLTGRHPEGPFAGEVLGKNSSEALDGTSHGTVNHDGAGAARGKRLLDEKGLLLLVLTLLGGLLLLSNLGLGSLGGGLAVVVLGLGLSSHVLEREVDGLLEVELDGGALPGAVEAVENSDIDLGAVEGTIALVQLPAATGLSSELVKSLLETSLSGVPGSDLTHVLLGASRELQLESEAKHSVEGLHKVEEIGNLSLNLILTAEDVGIILLESAHTGETGEGTAGLVSVEDTEISEPEGELLVTAVTVTEHHGVGRAVHRLETELLLVNIEDEHVILVMGQVAGLLPERGVEHVGGHDLVVTALPVLLLDVFHNSVVDAHTVGQPHGGTGRALLEVKELLLLANEAVIALGSLLEELLVGGHLLLIGERDTIDTLEGVVVGVTEEVGRRVLHDGESLDSAGVGNVRTTAKIDKGAVTVDSGSGAVGDLVLDDVLLVGVVGEHLEQILLAHLQSLERLLLLDDLGDNVLEGRPVAGLNGGTTGKSHFVVEAVVNGGTNAERAAESALAGLTENVSTRVPEDELALVVVEVEEFELAALLEGALKIP